MSQVSVTINSRQYRMACEDGQEDHLMALARELDERIGKLRAQFGQIGDSRLIVMAALMMADEVMETNARMQRLEQEMASLQDARVAAADTTKMTQAAIVAAFNSAAERIEGIARKLNQSVGPAGNVAMG
jgi:cell division protein ZapA